MERVDSVVSRSALIELVWGRDHAGDTKTLTLAEAGSAVICPR